jgi:toxin YoeB
LPPSEARSERICVLHPVCCADLAHWVETDRRVARRVLALIEAVMRDPTDGIGQPERLKFLDDNAWSRRITQEHRLVYLIQADRITFLQARYHYER